MKSNKIQKYILLAIMTFVVSFAYSQTNIRNGSPSIRKDLPAVASPNIRQDLGKKQSRKSDSALSKSRVNINSPHLKTDMVRNDTIYAMSNFKQHGWFEPKGIISREIARHSNVSFRFTNKNDKGRWLKMEVLDAYGQYAPGFMKPYILKNLEDSLANQNWKNKIESSCIYEFIPDPSGLNIIQERAYDKDYNIVYTYSRTGIGENDEGKQQFIGSYKDFYGFPAEMRPQEGYSYGTLVKITEDKWGNDSIIEYIDSKGINKLNADLAAKEYFICDKKGNLIMQQSRDSLGNLIIDNAGNCGIAFTYDEQGNMLTATFMNEKWEPMHLPKTKEAGEKAGIQRIEWKYDEYGRQTEMRFVDVNGNPEENVYGCHKTFYEYDEYGNTVKQSSYNIKNLPAASGFSGTSTYEFKYDNKGRIIEGHFLDTKQKPCSTEGYLSKIIKKYDENGDEILNEHYSAEKGNEEICYKYEKTPQFIYKRWNDGTSRIDSLDVNGRKTFVGFYGADGKLEITDGRAYELYTYIDEDKRTVIEEKQFDTKGNMVDINGREITVVDSVNWTKSIFRYNARDVLSETFIHRYSANFEQLLGQDDCNVYGIPSRSGGSSSVRYLKGNVVYTRKIDDDINITHLYGVDEFNEPDYISSSSLLYYYSKQFPHSATKYYDVHNAIIEDYHALRDSLPKVMTIEVVDSIAYQLGFKDNDVILRYDQYANDIRDHSNTHVRNAWGLYSVLAANKEKVVVIYRIDEKNPDGVIVNLILPKGSVSQLGFIPHIRYLTDKQANRIKNVLKQYEKEHNDFKSEFDIWLDTTMNDELGDKEITLVYPELYRANREKPYPHYVKDAGILIGYYVPESGDYWLCDGTTDKIDSLLNHRVGTSKYSPHIVYYFTTDMSNVSILNSYENYISGNWSSCNISDDNYNLLSGELVKFVNKDINNRIKKGKKTKSIDEANKLLRDSYSNLYTSVNNNSYKGVDKVELYDFSDSYSLRDSAYEIVESIANNKKEQYSFGSQNGYGSICLMSTQKSNRINKCFIFTSKTLIYVEGEFSQVQLNKISNLLK